MFRHRKNSGIWWGTISLPLSSMNTAIVKMWMMIVLVNQARLGDLLNILMRFWNIDYQARISKYRAKLFTDYWEPVPPVWKVLYTFGGPNHRRFIQSLSQHFGFTLPPDFHICNVRLPTRKKSCQAVNGCSTSGYRTDNEKAQQIANSFWSNI